MASLRKILLSKNASSGFANERHRKLFVLSLNGVSYKVVAVVGMEAGSTIASSKSAWLLSETLSQNRNGKKDEDVMQCQNASCHVFTLNTITKTA